MITDWNWVWPVAVAPFIGSFLGVLIRRLPLGQPVVLSRSACEQCGATIALRDLVPLASHVALGGRCRRCRGRIAAQHWQVELAAVAVAACAAAADMQAGRLWVDCGFGWALLALAWIDWDGLILPDVLTLPLIPAGLAATLWLDPADATDHAVAAAAGYAAFRGLGWLYARLRGREGLGQGDAKLLAALGAWTGLDGLPSVLLVAALAGLGLAGLLRLRGQAVASTTAIPFGPCLALAGWIVRLQS